MGRNSSFRKKPKDAVPEAERRPILLRAYAEPSKKPSEPRDGDHTPDLVLIFDTETTADETQQLRFGTYQLLENGKLESKGIFYDAVQPNELAALQAEAKKHGCKLLSRSEFVHRVFLKAAFGAGALVVGFNLPFDISRLAIGHSAARAVRKGRSRQEIDEGAPLNKADRFMVGGFSFKLSPYPDQPHLRIKQRNSRSSFYRFAEPEHQEAASSHRRRREKAKFERGHFLDLRTFAAALTSTSHSLDSLAKYLGVKHKGDFKDFDREIDTEFVEYALNDTEVTKQCYLELTQRYQRHRLSTAAYKIFSEASLGKAYLNQMNIRPWRKVQPDFDPKMLGKIMSTYFGGRAEIHLRRTVVPVVYCDFASMYPTVCTLMGLWKFVVGQGVQMSDVTKETQGLLETVDTGHLQKPEFWTRLTTLVRVAPDADIFPVRARYGDHHAQTAGPNDMPTIGVNYLTSEKPLWFTLADCVASKLLTGKAPKVVEAIHFSPSVVQENLRSIRVAGSEKHKIDPSKDDFYRRVIELRREIKSDLQAAKSRDKNSQEAKNLDMDQLALKILANATSYGIFIELNVEDRDEGDSFSVYTSQDHLTKVESKREQPGQFFHPILGTLITGAARLMLALTERLATENELDWAFCDTDSMAFANADQIPFEEFIGRVQKICDWFLPLNPYENDPEKSPVSILELEDENYSAGKTEPLYCFAISAKRYALFNLTPDGEPVIRKASAHGLGHYVPPYADNETAGPRGSQVAQWQEDVWRVIIKAALGSSPSEVNYAFRWEMTQPARSQYSASRPAVLNWFKTYNEDRLYAAQVKPFNFMLTFQMRSSESFVREGSEAPGLNLDQMRPVAPYARLLGPALSKVFDRNGDPAHTIPRELLRATTDVLRDYHRQPEYKFLGGGWNESGPLRRRHVIAEAIEPTCPKQCRARRDS
jgi:DNA polymerase type B, organellar and viral